MKKYILFMMSLLLMGSILGGCNSTSNGTKNNSVKKTSIIKTKTSYYQNLSKTDKKNVKFKFSQDKDETKDNSTDPVYIISVKITNNTKKIIKFDKSKFMVFVDESTKFPSSKTGTLTLKPGQRVSINQLIENVSEQALVGDTDYFVYLNMDNKLAKTTTVVPKIDVKESSPTMDDQDTSNQQTQQSQSTTTDNSANSSGQQDQDDNDYSAVFDANGNPKMDMSVEDGGITARVEKWQDDAEQEALNQGMSDDDAEQYAYQVAWQKENDFEADHD